MKKYLKQISKIVFVLVVGLLVFKLYTMAMNEDVKVVDQPVKTYQISQEDIISSGKEIVIKSFNDISNLKWLDHSKLLISGRIEENDQYLFDLKASELMHYKEDIHPQVDLEDYLVIQDIPGYGLLCTMDTKIGLLKDGEFQVIAEDATYKDQIKMQLSEDLSKLLYYHHKNESLITYNFEKNFFKTIRLDLDDQILSNFDETIQVSPLGGYVSVEYRLEDLEESHFSIYGADSGRLYADKVYGMHLSWSKDDEKVCYYYSKESQSFDETLDGMTIGSHRIGYYDVVNKKISYIDSSSQSEWMLSKIYWSDHRITMLAGEIEEEIYLSKLISYDFDEEQYHEWSLDFEALSTGTKIDLIDYEEAYILLVESEATYEIFRINKETKEIIPYNDLLAFDTLEEEKLYFLKDQQKFLTVNDENIVLTWENNEYYISVDGSYFIVPSPNLDYIAVWFIEPNEIVILETK